MATEMIKGKPVSEALELSNKAVIEALDGLPAQKIHCSVLAEEAVKAAVKDYYDKNGIAYDADLFSTHDCAACHGGCTNQAAFFFLPPSMFLRKAPDRLAGCFLSLSRKKPRQVCGSLPGGWRQ